MYADYTFYTDTFFGNVIAEADFSRLSSRASDFLDYYTRDKARNVTDEDVVLLLGKACCAIAEQMFADENAKELARKATAAAIASGTGELKSESVGSYSVSYATAGDYTKASMAGTIKDMRAAYAYLASEYLAHTGLLYRGGC